MALFSKLFKSYSEKQINKIEPVAAQVEALSDRYAAMSDEELGGTTVRLREQLQAGKTLDDLLPDAFAAVREAAWRVLGKRPYHVQILGGILLHQGRIAEMRTGEGKTLMETMPAYLNALEGKGVHIVTVNDYLARRDSEWNGNIFRFLGMSVGLVTHEVPADQKKASYLADITYGTNNEFGFDYLRDNMAVYKERVVQRGHHFAIVDEVDSILIDEARTPLIISGPGEDSSEMYSKADEFVRRLKCFRIKEFDKKKSDEEIAEDYIVDEKARTSVLTANGVRKAEAFFHVENLGDVENNELMHYINNALRARGVMQLDVDYVIKDGKVLIVDAFTGRIMPGRRYSNGLHQAIEAKEGVEVAKENKTLATITFQNYFRMYDKLSGMTGTAMTEEDEFREIYMLDVVEVPTNKPMIREDHNDVVYKSIRAKNAAIIDCIQNCHAKGQPVLVGTVSVEKSEALSSILKRNGIPHQVLNAKYHEREAEIIAQAGKLGAVTIATNMAGRGTDIQLGGNADFLAKQQMRKEDFPEELIAEADSYGHTEDPELIAARNRFAELKESFRPEIEAEAEQVRKAGGLFILGTERHESRRIDNQLRGRAGRQGDPGESRFYIAMEDDLMRLFGADRIIGLIEALRMPEDQPIDAKILSGSIESAQKKIEGMNFERRKNVIAYDDVMNQQRELIYQQRREVLGNENVSQTIRDMITRYVTECVERATQSDVPDEWDFASLQAEFGPLVGLKDEFTFDQESLGTVTREFLCDTLNDLAMKKYEQQEEAFTPETFREIERALLLRNVDRNWMEYIDEADDLKGSVGLNAYAQRNPVVEFKIASSEMFEEMVSDIRAGTVRMVLTVVKREQAERKQVRVTSASGGGTPVPQKPASAPVRREKKVGPNDPCPCGSGKKYKKCCGAVGGQAGAQKAD
ncbi:MAG: preprotein translocase subunit SecA [Oscillospiraceae bacterium]|nr:preprotein translocase subunit SecA [Oscillospiraceae bacterium]